MADASWMDAMPAVAPTPGHIMSGVAKAPEGVATPGQGSKGGASWMDAMPAVEPTTAMKMSGIGVDQPKNKGIAANVAAGANQAIFGALGAPVDLMSGALNMGARAVGLPEFHEPPGSSGWLKRQFGKVSVDPDTVQPATEGERMAQGFGGAVAQVPMMALGGAGVAPALRGVAKGAAESMAGSGGATGGTAALTAGAAGAGGAVGQGFEDAVPEPAKPYANLAGNLLGAGAVAGGAMAATKGNQIIARKAGELGIGRKETIGDVRATRAQINAAGQQVGEALGPEGQQQLGATLANEGEARQLEATIAHPDTLPAEKQTAQTRLDEIQSQRMNVVPGSEPTTAQVAPTPGVVDLETAHRVADGSPFVERAQAQNDARVAAINSAQPEGSPLSVGQMFAKHLDDLDAQFGQKAETARSGVTGQSAAIGGEQPTVAYGGQMREALQGAQEPVHVATRRAWAAVDPEGSWALEPTALRQTAAELKGNVSPTAQVDSQEMALINRAASLPNVVKFKELGQIRRDINQATPRMVRAGLDIRQMTLLKKAVDQSISDAVDAKAANDPRLAGVLRGEFERGASSDRPAGTQPISTVAASGNSPEGGAGIQGQGVNGPRSQGSVAGNSSVATGTAVEGKLASNFSEEHAAQYRDAVAATRAEKERFGQGGVGESLRRGDDAGFKTAEGNVPGKIFTDSATEPTEVARYIEAVGGADKAVEIGKNVLANDLRNKGIIQPDGTVNASRLEAWRARRAATLEQFPGLGEKFGNLESAQRTYDDALAAHKTAIQEFNHSAAAKFISDDPLKAVAKAFQSANPTETFRDLAAAVRGHAEAEAGLKRAVVDYILQQQSSVVPSATEGVNMLKAGQFQQWVQKNRTPLRMLFGGQGPQVWDMVAADMRRAAQRTTAVGGSQTKPHDIRAQRTGVGAHATHGAGLTALTLIGERIGEMTHGGGLVGAIALPIAGTIAHAMKQAGIRTKTDLVREAMLHPELAHALVQRTSAAKEVSGVLQRRIGAAMHSAVLADISNDGDQRQ